MKGEAIRNSLSVSACVLALALGGCGGGGGGTAPQPIPAPAPAPAPAPPPPPPPPPPATTTGFNDAEYQRSNGANTHNALAAYDAGGTGRGVKIALVDSGINPALAEFAGRIDPASRDIAASRGVVDNEGHGTAVAGVAAAARNGEKILGVAFDATILSLNTANPNDCDADGCNHSDVDIATAVDVARTNGARVVNISLGGDGASPVVADAIRRAVAAGMVIVVSAGNDGAANPDEFARQIATQGSGNVVIAGAMAANRQLASFSNSAGTAAQYYLTALGERVRTFDNLGREGLYSGTSFSAPVISGAAALLASAFPNLTGAQIVDLLLSSADDAGAAGDDPVFGNGILNIQRAFAPKGTTALAGSAIPVSVSDNGTTSGPMGDTTPQSVGAIILDGYSRAYALDLAKTLAVAAPEQPLARSLTGHLRSAAAASGATAVSITIDRNLHNLPVVGLAQTGLSYQDSRAARTVAALAVSRIAPGTAVALGFSESGRTLQRRLAGAGQNAFLVARDPADRAGFDSNDSRSIGARQRIGKFGVTLTGERGEVYQYDARFGAAAPRYEANALTLDGQLGPATLMVGASRLSEQATILGARFSSGFTSGGATSTFLDGSAAFDLGRGWSAFASYRRGWTQIAGTGAMVDHGRLSSSAFAFDIAKRNAFRGGDWLALRLMQPLRIRSGGFAMNVPTSYDYATGQAGFEQRQLSLAPSGREIDAEIAYGISLPGGSLGANAFFRRQPGHIASAADDVGAAVRLSLDF